MDITYFKWCFKRYVLRCDDRRKAHYTLWAIAPILKKEYFLGMMIKGEACETPFERQLPWDVSHGMRKLIRILNSQNLTEDDLQNIRLCYDGKMTRVSNIQRNKDILKKREQGWTFKELGKYFNLSESTVHDVIRKFKQGIPFTEPAKK